MSDIFNSPVTLLLKSPNFRIINFSFDLDRLRDSEKKKKEKKTKVHLIRKSSKLLV